MSAPTSRSQVRWETFLIFSLSWIVTPRLAEVCDGIGVTDISASVHAPAGGAAAVAVMAVGEALVATGSAVGDVGTSGLSSEVVLVGEVLAPGLAAGDLLGPEHE
jgi:hypothetical protein